MNVIVYSTEVFSSVDLGALTASLLVENEDALCRTLGRRVD